jgi:hypothetical protein
MKRRLVWESQHIDDEEEDDDEDGYDDDDPGFDIKKAMLTPIGLYQVDDKMGNPYRQFDIWMGHTNFVIDAQVATLIEETTGVEIYKTLTPYRFLVAPAKLFDWKDVATLIKKRICGSTSEETIANLEPGLKKHVGEIIEQLREHDFWRIYIFPNGKIYHKPYDGLMDYHSGEQEFAKLEAASNGIIITSD